MFCLGLLKSNDAWVGLMSGAFVAQRSKETAKREQMQKDMGSR